MIKNAKMLAAINLFNEGMTDPSDRVTAEFVRIHKGEYYDFKMTLRVGDDDQQSDGYMLVDTFNKDGELVNTGGVQVDPYKVELDPAHEDFMHKNIRAFEHFINDADLPGQYPRFADLTIAETIAIVDRSLHDNNLHLKKDEKKGRKVKTR